MSPFNPSKPSSPIETETLTTATGVKVNVRHPPPPEPRREPELAEQLARVVILPPGEPAGKRAALLTALCTEHGAFIQQRLLARGDVLEESTKDLTQEVLLTLCKEVEKKPIENVRGFLRGVIRNQVSNHKRHWIPEGQPGAEVDAEVSPSTSPEGKAERAERRAKLTRYLTTLPQEEAEVIRCIDLYEMTLRATAEAVRRPCGTVATQYARAKVTLAELAHASERATALGKRRRPRR